jgi:hypothetical protein
MPKPSSFNDLNRLLRCKVKDSSLLEPEGESFRFLIILFYIRLMNI